MRSAAEPDPDTLVQLALQDLRSQAFAAAEAKCLRALNANRDHSDAWIVLGMVLQAQQRHDDAIRIFNALTLRQPQVVNHWSNLGAALRTAKRYDQAADAYRRGLELGPASAQLLYNIALVHMDRYDYPSAYEALAQAVGTGSTDAWIRCTFAQCSYDLGDVETAQCSLERWTEFQGLTNENMVQIASLLITLGKPDSAAPAVERLTRDPPDGGAGLALANIYERTNRLSDARASLARHKASVAGRATDPDLLLTEAVLEQRDGNHEQACTLLLRALQEHGDFLRRHMLLFPLAQSLDALRRFDAAYAALVEAHRSQAAYLQAIIGKTTAEASPTLALASQRCDPKDVASWDDADAPGLADSPIFVVAFPRSGTTLLEQTLDAHPKLKSMDERAFLKQAVDDVTDFGVGYPAELGKLSVAQLHSVRRRYWERVHDSIQLSPGQRLVDKNPLNLLRLPLIRRLFPQARTILAYRHPCDTVLSCFLQHFRAPDLALLCRDLPTLATSYRAVYDFWYQQWPLLGASTCEVQYEQLVGNFPAQVRLLSDFLELPWNDAMLAPGEHARAKGYISTPSYAQVVRPVNSRAVGRWRGYERYFHDVLPVLEPYLQHWGYSGSA